MPPTPYASGSPIVDSLFGREFANYQVEDRARQQAAANEIARQQIMAQSELARAQQQSNAQQQQYNNLFRERDFAAKEKGDEERNALFKRQLDSDEKARVPRTDLEAERRKNAIIDANSTAANDASRANALFKINLEEALKTAKAGLHWYTMGGPSAANLDDPAHPAYRAIQKQVFDRVRNQLLSEKGGALNNLIPDDQTFEFKPVQFDDKGNAIVAPYKAPPGSIGSGFDYMGNPIASAANPAALGPTVPTIPGTSTVAPDYDSASFLKAIIQPSVNKAFSSMADMFGIKAPATPTVQPATSPSVKRLLVDAAGRETSVMLTPADDAELQRQLIAIVPEQRPAAYRTIIGQLLQNGRALMSPNPYANFEIPSASY